MWWWIVGGVGRVVAAETDEGERSRRWVIPRSRRRASACEGSSGKSLLCWKGGGVRRGGEGETEKMDGPA